MSAGDGLTVLPADQASWDDLQAVCGTSGETPPLPMPVVQGVRRTVA